ncbi:cellulose 1,4-beta-cellobiosidase precursor [mine drainage metagenome]|uniref:Cellulose 1,4-beta-cellobiosidase n=1 Tax=mine drainage metagenome TaxID=410659 RepID=A0A1J5SNY7_9ZZZZ
MPRPSVARLFVAVLLSALASVSARAVMTQWRAWAVPALTGKLDPDLPPVTSHLHVDQFGYLPWEQKVAVISDPQKGFNTADRYTPGSLIELRRKSDGAVVLARAPAPFNRLRTDAQSGDRGWWFDFSQVQTPGEYYVFDAGTGLRSATFRIAPDVYAPVLRAAMRVFYYQREACAHELPYAQKPWTDAPAFLNDRHARAVWAKGDPATERDLSGGWMDAGDSNKYPTFLRNVIHPLLYAWSCNPQAFTDDTGIPESGNGLPDILDEVKWELDWLLKMEDRDGGVFIKMGEIDYNTVAPLSKDDRPRYYGPKASASTIVTAGVLAHAARVYGQFPAWTGYATLLRQKAELAWNWYSSHPRREHVDTGEIKSGNADLSFTQQDRAEAIAALQLWLLTGRPAYKADFEHKVFTLRQLSESPWSPYDAGEAEGLFEYLRNPHADPVLVRSIRRIWERAVRWNRFIPRTEQPDLYRAYMPDSCYHWGSNQVRASFGAIAAEAVTYGFAGPDRALFEERALNMLHFFHGVNPLDLVYLSNMGSLGAENSVTRIWHDAYPTNSDLGANPPPGYVVGGPNAHYDGALGWVRRQPPGKAYADFNLPYPDDSWELSEPAIYNQAMYVRLLANFTRQPAPAAR